MHSLDNVYTIGGKKSFFSHLILFFIIGQRQKIGNLLVAQYSSHSKHLEGYKYPTMDDVPIPCGSWQEDYDNNQRKYNLHLLLGAGFFIITMVSVSKGSKSAQKIIYLIFITIFFL